MYTFMHERKKNCSDFQSDYKKKIVFFTFIYASYVKGYILLLLLLLLFALLTGL